MFINNYLWVNIYPVFKPTCDLPGEQSVGQLDVVDDGLLWVPLGVHRIGCGQDGGTGIQGADDACLGNRQCLLFLKKKKKVLFARYHIPRLD